MTGEPVMPPVRAQSPTPPAVSAVSARESKWRRIVYRLRRYPWSVVMRALGTNTWGSGRDGPPRDADRSFPPAGTEHEPVSEPCLPHNWKYRRGFYFDPVIFMRCTVCKTFRWRTRSGHVLERRRAVLPPQHLIDAFDREFVPGCDREGS